MTTKENLNLEVFSSPEFGQMRILAENGKYLFCASDAATALGYSNPRSALQRHCKGVVKRDTLTSGGTQTFSYISEGDLYRLIVHSKLPGAEKFEHWVFDEVLPCIRKRGGYMTDIFNSTSLDCTHKFKNFYFSGLAVQRLSDMTT